MTDDLSAPLGQDTPKKRRLALPSAVPKMIAAALGLFIAAFLLWATIADDPLGGEPMVVVSADPMAPGVKNGKEASAHATAPGAHAATDKSESAAPSSGRSGKEAGGPVQTVTIIDGSSGKRQEIAIPAVDEKLARLVDPELLETTRHGLIPRIGPNGARAMQVYARPLAKSAQKPDASRIAIVLDGLGIGSNTTSEALGKLPGAITLAFSPYGIDVDRVVARARSEGHEILLQVPMEPFDYPDNDPGPETLLTSLAPEQNIDRMHWLMSRFQGYVGITNYMGARFTATDQAFAPVLREASKRGLLYFDDGTSPRSLASQLAGANNLPFVKADVVIDSVPTPTEIDGAFAKLETMAREHGVAVGVMKALPVSVARLSAWAKTIASRGFVLVPISAVATKAKSS